MFSVKVISRSNSAPIGWSKISLKGLSLKNFKFVNEVLVNSYQFKKDLKKQFNVNAKTIYNPLNKIDIIKNQNRNQRKFLILTKIKILNIGRFTHQKDQMTF